MRHFNPGQLTRSTIGFDRLFSIFDQLSSLDAPNQSYPPYNIEKTGENAYRISIAAAGFAESELSIEAREGVLTVRGGKAQPQAEDKPEFLFQGIAARAFERQFQLADHVNTVSASLENGLLHIDLVREVPEAKRPRRIPISGKPDKSIELAAA